MNTKAKARPLFDPLIVRRALRDALRKMHPLHQTRNPVMFTVYVGSILTTVLGLVTLAGHGHESPAFVLGISAWLWFTVLFANFAEAMAEGRGKAQAESLRQARQEVTAYKLAEARLDAPQKSVAASSLRKGDLVLVRAGEIVPGDGEAVEGVRSRLPGPHTLNGRERPVNLRPGRVTLIRLPSGEIIRLRAVQEGRGKRLGAQLPVGPEIDHEK